MGQRPQWTEAEKAVMNQARAHFESQPVLERAEAALAARLSNVGEALSPHAVITLISGGVSPGYDLFMAQLAGDEGHPDERVVSVLLTPLGDGDGGQVSAALVPLGDKELTVGAGVAVAVAAACDLRPHRPTIQAEGTQAFWPLRAIYERDQAGKICGFRGEE